MVAVEKWQEGHEDICALRYQGIEVAFGALKATINKAVWLLVSVLIALLGWMGAQMYNGLQADIHRSQMAAPASISQRAGG